MWSWGTVKGFGTKVEVRRRPQTEQRYANGPEIDRTSQAGTTKARVGGSFSQGRLPLVGQQPWTQVLGSYIYNPGFQTRHPGPPVLPPVLTTNGSHTSDVDISAYVAANKRAHMCFSTVGSSSGGRLYIGLGPLLYRETSTSDPALVVAHTFTNNITAIWEGIVNGSPSLIVATDGATDDISYTTDPTAGPITWAVLVALSAGDYITAGAYFPTVGGRPFHAIIGEIGGVQGAWYILTTAAPPLTAAPLVLAADKDVEGTITAVTAAVQYPPEQTAYIAEGSEPVTVTNMSNVEVDDGSYATITFTTIGQKAGIYGYGFTLPAGAARSARISNLLIEVQAKESNADDNIERLAVQVMVDGTERGPEFVINAPEIATSDTTYSINLPAIGLTMGDLETMTLRVSLSVNAGSAVSPVATIDFIRMTPTYITPGDMVGFFNGGYGIGRSPFNESRMAIVVPDGDDAADIDKKRVLYTLDFEWDNSGDRPVVTLSRPNTGMDYVHHACWFSGNIAVTGSGKAGPGLALKHVDSSGQLRDFSYPGHNGKVQTRINSLYAQGTWLIFEEVATDYTERQWVFWSNSRYFSDTMAQSLSGTTISAQPIPLSTSAIDVNQNRIFSLFPNSTDTAAARCFLYPDLGQDPRLVFTSEVRSGNQVGGENTDYLYMILPEVDLGPEEAGKSITVISYQGRRVGAANSSTYGPVILQVVTDADATFASPEISTGAITAGLAADPSSGRYDVPSAGVAYRTAQIRLGAKRGSGATTASPDVGPWLVWTYQNWYDEFDIYIYLDESTFKPNLEGWLDEVNTLKETKITQELVYEDRSWSAAFGHVQAQPKILAPKGQSSDRTDHAGVQYIAVFHAQPGTP